MLYLTGGWVLGFGISMRSTIRSRLSMKEFISSRINKLNDFFGSGSAQMYSIILILILLSLVPILVLGNGSSINNNLSSLENYANPSFSLNNLVASKRADQITQLIGAMIQDSSNLQKDSVLENPNETTNETSGSGLDSRTIMQVQNTEQISNSLETNLSQGEANSSEQSQESNLTQTDNQIQDNETGNQTQTELNITVPSNTSTESLTLTNETNLINENSTQNGNITIPEANITLPEINESNETELNNDLGLNNETNLNWSNETESNNQTNETNSNHNFTSNQTADSNQTSITIPELINQTNGSLENETQTGNQTSEQNQSENNETNGTEIEAPIGDIEYPSDQIIITQGLTQGKIIIGEPIVWILSYSVYNPTNETIYNHPVLLNIPSESFDVGVLE